MVEKRTCDYTGDDIEPGTGTMYVKVDGTVLHFKDSKAEKNYMLGREARDLEWTTTGRRQAERAQASRDAAGAAAAAASEADEPEAVEDIDEADEADEADAADEAEAETESEPTAADIEEDEDDERQ